MWTDFDKLLTVVNFRYKCPDCDKNFTSQIVLKNHQNFVHGDSKEFKCILCKYETNYKNGLTNHMKHKHGKSSKYMHTAALNCLF